MPPAWSRRRPPNGPPTQSHIQRVGVKRPPLYLEQPSTHMLCTCQGLVAHLQRHNFAAKAAVFFHGCAILLFFQLFILYWSIADQQCDSFRGQQKDSAIHTHVSFSPRLPSLPGCHMTLSRVPCAVGQLALAGYPFSM